MRYSDDGFLEFEETEIARITCYTDTPNKLNELNRLLRKEQEEWVVVSGNVDEYSMSEFRSTTGRGTEKDSHVSRLMPPRPIQKGSFEQLAKDIAYKVHVSDDEWDVWKARARKLLEDKK